MKYQIGQTLYAAQFSSHGQAHKTCPDCGGTRFFTAVMFDGEQHKMDCQTCTRGYEGPIGTVPYYVATAGAKEFTIAGVEARRTGEVMYWQDNGNGIEEEWLFPTMEEALAAAEKRVEDYNKKQLEQIHKKVKNDRTWSWHVSYHRRQLKEAERNVAHHSEKLGIAKAKAKEGAA